MRIAIPMAAFALAGCSDNRTPVPEDYLPPTIDCIPDRDGEITAAELPVAIGQTLPFYVSTAPRTVDLSPSDEAGVPVWDLSVEHPDDVLADLGPSDLAGTWYAGQFPSGQFVLAASGGLEAVYHLDDVGLFLHGLASVEPDPPAGQTLLVYDTPVPVLRLPMSVSDAYTAEGAVANGMLDGLPYVGTDTYEVAVTGSGRLDVPFVRFSPVLEVRTRVIVTPAAGGVTTSRRQVSYFFECFGEIARAESQADEPDPDFTTAAVLQRFAL